MAKGLYDNIEYFLLRHGDDIMVIDEPEHFGDALVAGLRDEANYGFSSEFIDDEKELRFPPVNGGDFINGILDVEGAEAKIYFEFGFLVSGVRKLLFKGKLFLYDWIGSKSKGAVAKVERVAFESTLRINYDSSISLNGTKDLDDNDITPATSLLLQMHSREIIREAKTTYTDPTLTEDISAEGEHETIFLQFDTTNQTVSDLPSLQTMPAGLSFQPPFIQERYIFLAEEGGFLEFKLAWTGEFAVDSANPIETCKLRISVRRGGDEITNIIVDVIFVLLSPSTIDFSSSYSTPFSFLLNLQKGDKVFCALMFTYSPLQDPTHAFVYGFGSELSFKQITTAPRTNNTAFRIYDYLNYLIYSATGSNNRLISNFYNTGFGAKYALLNGFSIRNFDVDNHPLTNSIEKSIDSLRCIFNTGVGYRTWADADYMVVEDMMYFFKTNPILKITEVFDYEEVYLKQYVYNKLLSGYKEYAEDEANTLEEFNTNQEVLTAIRQREAPLNRVSDFIAAGSSIEQLRRKFFEEKPTDSAKNDDETFIVAYTDYTHFKALQYVSFGDDIIYFDRDLGLVPGDYVTIFGNDTNDGATFLIQERINLSDYGWKISTTLIATPSGLEDTELSIAADPGVKITERSEPFSVLSGITLPGTIYNGRISPKHMEYAQAPLLNIGMTYTDGSKKLKTTFVKNNGNLTTKFFNSEPNKGYIGTQTVQEKSDIVLADYALNIRPFTPRGCTVKVKLSGDEILLLVNALHGQLNNGSDPRDHGCIEIRDDTGKDWLMHVLSYKYSPKTWVCELLCAKIRPI